MTEQATAFREWAVLELMGHRRLAGLLTEQEIGGHGFLRIDIPNNCTGVAASWCPTHGTCSCERTGQALCPLHSETSGHDERMTTQFYAPGAVYAITPTTEEVAREVARKVTHEPISRWDVKGLLKEPEQLHIEETAEGDLPF